MERIKEIDREEVDRTIGEEVKMERRDLKAKLDDLLHKEEISWNQNGNSKLFHRIVSQNKMNKMITKLERQDGTISGKGGGNFS